jgi:hypothetical protein
MAPLEMATAFIGIKFIDVRSVAIVKSIKAFKE